MRSIMLAVFTFSSIAYATEAPTPSPSPDLPALSTSTADLSNPAYLIELANVHLKFGSVQRAQPFLRKALELSKDAGQRDSVLITLRSTFQRLGNWKEAVPLYQDFLSTALNASGRSKINLALADACAKSGDVDKAESILTDAAKPDKDRSDDKQQRQSAFIALVQLWEANPTRVDGSIAQAEADLAKNADDLAALERLMRIYSVVRKDIYKQITYTERYCALNPSETAEQKRLAGLYLQDSKYDKAIEIDKRLMTAAATPEESQNIAREIGNILVRAGKKDEAVTWMHENFEAKITRTGDYIILSAFYESADMAPAAEMALLKMVAVATTPDQDIEARVRIAELALRRKNYDHAEEVVQSIVKDHKDRPGVGNRVNSLFQRIEDAKKKSVVLPPPMPVKIPNTVDGR